MMLPVVFRIIRYGTHETHGGGVHTKVILAGRVLLLLAHYLERVSVVAPALVVHCRTTLMEVLLLPVMIAVGVIDQMLLLLRPFVSGQDQIVVRVLLIVLANVIIVVGDRRIVVRPAITLLVEVVVLLQSV